jgi:uncharacterized protein (TIGR02145 family)
MGEKKVGLLDFLKKGSSGGKFTDSRDGRTYGTAQIGNQVWMTENLAYSLPDGQCWGSVDRRGERSPLYEPKYGTLYDWETAKRVSPQGWHLPTSEEFKSLIEVLGGEREARDALLPGGRSGLAFWFAGGCNDVGIFNIARSGYYWTASEPSYPGARTMAAVYLDISRDDRSVSLVCSDNNKLDGYSVRCIRD